MRYVIIRDDDTNALTPIDCLERLYRPFLDRGLPVNLATIPEVRADISQPDGRREGFLPAKGHIGLDTVPLGENGRLVSYLLDNPGYRIVQHGCHHDFLEFERKDRFEVARRLERGTRRLVEAGIPRPQTFVAPYDRLSHTSLEEVSKRFRFLSTGWFEAGYYSVQGWPPTLLNKLLRWLNWRLSRVGILSHTGCLLSCHRPTDAMLAAIKTHIANRQLTVLVTRWWEYFKHLQPDEALIRNLHLLAAHLSSRTDIRVITFDDIVIKKVRLDQGW